MQDPFKRGSLTFEDYNYAVYNPFILVKTQEKQSHPKLKASLS